MHSPLAADDNSGGPPLKGPSLQEFELAISYEEGKSDQDAVSDDEDVEWEDAGVHAGPQYQALQAEIAGIGAALEEAEEQEEDNEELTDAEQDASHPERPTEVIGRALAANRRLQSRLADILAAADKAIWRNAETQAKLMHHAEAWPRAGRYRGMRETSNAVWGNADVRVMGPSRFWVADRRVPEPNADALKTAPAFQYLPHTFQPATWTPAEHERLKSAILQTVDRIRTARALAGAGRPGQSANGAGTEEQPIKLDSPGVEAEVDAFGAELWDEVARLGGSGRGGRECASEWAHRLRPSLNLGPWSVEEDAKLVQLQAQHGMHSWEIVARELATGRTAAACLARYQRCHNAVLLESKWTAEDAARLAAIVARLGTSNWTTVAAEMGNRTAQQVQHYYRDNLHALKKGAWSPDEDAALLKAVETCGRRWREVAKLVPARSDKQCRERFCNVLDPELKREDEWAPEEDAALRAAIAQHTQPNGKVRWAKVGAMLPGRTDNSCWRRSKTLAAMERGTFKQPSAPRGSGGRFSRAAPSSADRDAPPQPGTSKGATSGSDAGVEMAAEAPDSVADRSTDGIGDGKRSSDGEPAEGEGAAADVLGSGRGRRRGRRRGAGRAARSTGASTGEQGSVDAGEGGNLEAAPEEAAQASGAVEEEAGPPPKKPRKRAGL